MENTAFPASQRTACGSDDVGTCREFFLADIDVLDLDTFPHHHTAFRRVCSYTHRRMKLLLVLLL